MITVGLIIVGLVILFGLVVAAIMLGGTWFGTGMFPPPEERGGSGPGGPDRELP
ncbi:MAG: hypothetical protein U0237_16570 [Thermoleophilia bacterium]